LILSSFLRRQSLVTWWFFVRLFVAVFCALFVAVGEQGATL
jgi:hypothetical protein